MNEYWGKLRWRFDEGSNTDIVDDIGVIDVLDVPMEKSDAEDFFVWNVLPGTADIIQKQEYKNSLRPAKIIDNR